MPAASLAPLEAPTGRMGTVLLSDPWQVIGEYPHHLLASASLDPSTLLPAYDLVLLDDILGAVRPSDVSDLAAAPVTAVLSDRHEYRTLLWAPRADHAQFVGRAPAQEHAARLN